MSSGRSRNEPVWTRTAPGSRKPAYSRELIVETAIAIADSEGFDAVSMRRIASELGAGTMTIYHYIATKDELLALIGDRMMSEMIIADDELPEGWRDGFAEIARRTLAIFIRHPWIVEHMSEGGPEGAGPNVLRHVEQTLEVASRTGLSIDDQFELAEIIDDYAFGHAMRSISDAKAQSEGGFDAMLTYLKAQLDSGDYPRLKAFAGDDPDERFAQIGQLSEDPERFERGLQRLLDGLELWINKAHS